MSANKKQKVKEKVYFFLKKIPKGKVTTYKAIANACNISARQVGKILSENPYYNVPCHRVVRSDGNVGGFTWEEKQNQKKKITLLKKEGVNIKGKKILNFKQVFLHP
ncbi:cysteine methyltransferase [Candidatus Pacearchaeota archaeon ex4484_26]|nr:MAG: cysteine methyltransferase [Candidatus Pacearchaeota archaeon ex4484_26]